MVIESAEDRPHRGGERHHDHAHHDGDDELVVREELLYGRSVRFRRRSERIDEHEHRQRDRRHAQRGADRGAPGRQRAKTREMNAGIAKPASTEATTSTGSGEVSATATQPAAAAASPHHGRRS
ncbi:hypothetical protein [Rhodococcus koreensis]|uniref:hypothetical protein n=1 Tax=Rhodococcus koreensis TaxID=99653 RepID=UPI0036DE9407